MPVAHWLLALAAVFIWGTNFVVIAWGLSSFPPFLFAALRFGLTAFPLMLFVPRPAVRWRDLAGFGLLVGAGQFGLLFFAMHRYITPGLASLIIQVQALFTIAISVVFRGHRIRALQVCALALSMAGICLVAWRSATGAGSAVTLAGVMLVLAGAMCWAFANLLVQSLGTVNVVAFLVWSSVFSVPPLLVLSMLFDHPFDPLAAFAHASLAAWAAVLWQVIGNTLFGFGVWNWLLARHPAATVTPIALLVPVFGMTASAWALSEPLPAWKIYAAALVLMGLAINAYVSSAGGSRSGDQP